MQLCSEHRQKSRLGILDYPPWEERVGRKLVFGEGLHLDRSLCNRVHSKSFTNQYVISWNIYVESGTQTGFIRSKNSCLNTDYPVKNSSLASFVSSNSNRYKNNVNRSSQMQGCLCKNEANKPCLCLQRLQPKHSRGLATVTWISNPPKWSSVCDASGLSPNP